MSPGRARVLFASCLVVQGMLTLGITIASRRGEAPSSLAIGVALCFVPYMGALLAARSTALDRSLTQIALASAAVVGGLYVWSPPAFSDDLYRYLWEGRLWLEGYDPYHLAPDDPALAHLRDGVWEQINNKPIASIYPPLSQLPFAACAWLGGEAWTVKIVALFGHLLGTFALARLSDEPRAALALGLNPLLLSESAMNGHLDILVGTSLLAAAWALSRRRFVHAGAAMCAAIGLKLVGWVVVPLLWQKPRALAVTVAVSIVLCAPVLASWALSDPVSGAGQFATRWRGNESVFALVDWLARRFLSEEPAGHAARLVVGALLVAIIGLAVVRRTPPLPASRTIVWGALLLSPQVHPWYLGWLLPLELASGARAGLAWSAVILCAYAPLDRWVAEGAWEMPLSLQLFEYVVVGLALMGDPRRPRL